MLLRFYHHFAVTICQYEILSQYVHWRLKILGRFCLAGILCLDTCHHCVLTYQTCKLKRDLPGPLAVTLCTCANIRWPACKLTQMRNVILTRVFARFSRFVGKTWWFIFCRTFFYYYYCVRHNTNSSNVVKTWLGINVLLHLQEERASVVYDGGAAQTDVNHVSCERS